MGDEEGTYNPTGYVLLFSLISVFTLFFIITFYAVLNNYALSELYNLVNQYAISGLIPESYVGIADTIASTTPSILPVIDFLWFSAFITMVISSVIFSYNRPRASYFSLLTTLILGIVIFMYVGTFFIDITNWFITEIYTQVLPTISTYTPIFNWYISNLSIINLILIVVITIANFVDLDFSKFFRRKEGESFDEI